MLLAFSCTSIDQFSSNNSIQDFYVKEVITDDVVLQNHSISQKEKTIYLLLSYGVHNLPIQFTHSTTTADKNANIIDLPDTINIDSPSDIIPFHVMAPNGKTAQWKIALKVIDRNPDADLISVKVNHNQKFISDSALINPIDTSVYIIAPEVIFPADISLTCILSDSAILFNNSNNLELSFSDYNTTHSINIKAADGQIKKWKVSIFKPSLITDNSSVAWSQWYKLSFIPHNTTVSANYDIKKTIIDFDNNNIITILESPEIPDDLKLSIASSFSENVEMLGYKFNNDINLNANSDSTKIYIIDRVSLMAKRWSIKASKQLSASTNIKNVLLLNSTPSNINIDFDNILIDNNNACIVIPIIDGIENMPLSLKSLILTDDNALIENKNELRLNSTFNSINDIDKFTVTAQDNYTERIWSMMCVLDSNFTPQADVILANILSYASTEDRVVLDDNANIDNTNNIITISVKKWPTYLPLRVNLGLNLSYGASSTLTNPLVFNSLEDYKTITVNSSDNKVTKNYNIVLADKSIQMNSAELLNFSISAIEPNFIVDNVNINSSDSTVYITVTQSGSSQFSFVPNIKISEGASLHGIANNARFIFGDLVNSHSFQITSEDESTSKQWNIKVKYHPQIPNSNLNSWFDSYTPQTWNSANNSFGKNTQRITRDNGYAAQLSTSSIIGNIAAGSLFLGKFKMNLDYISEPRKMTFFGVPFSAKPSSMSFDYTYSSSGTDRGSVIIELLNFENDDVEYHGIGNEVGATIIHSGKLFLDKQEAWTNINVPISPQNSSLPITHIHIVFSSSFNGENLQGDIGAILKVDNITLNYE